ncbi:MAG: DUF805 domain-containing protein [Actinomycetota bacterium]|nr:DUF805 domain-containing protein [Actinomycetota bacterium]
MSFGQSVQYCFNNYANFDGRASRSQFWWFTLFLILVSIPLSILDRLIFRDSNFGVLSAIWWLATVVPHLAVGSRRLHDTAKSGWLQLLILVCCIGYIPLIIFWAQPAVPGPNQYGETTV